MGWWRLCILCLRSHTEKPLSRQLFSATRCHFGGNPCFGGVGGGGTSGYSHQNKKNNFLKITQVQKKTEKCKLFWKMECFFVNQHYCDGFCSNVRHRVRFQMTKRAKRGRLCRHREVACAASRWSLLQGLPQKRVLVKENVNVYRKKKKKKTAWIWNRSNTWALERQQQNKGHRLDD